MEKEIQRLFKGSIIESGNAYTIVYKDETGMLRILQIWWEEKSMSDKEQKTVYQLESINLEAEEIQVFLKAIQEVT